MNIDAEHRLEHRRSALRRARGELAQFGDDFALRNERIVDRERREPALGRSDIAEGS